VQTMAALCRDGKGRSDLSRPSTGKYGGDMKEGGMSAALRAVRQAWRMCCLRRTFGCCAAVNHWPACVHVGLCSGSWHHHFGSSSGRSDLLISSVRRKNCPGNRPTAQPSPNGRRGSRQSPGGNLSPKHSWFYQTATGTASPLSINPSPTRTPAVKVAGPNGTNR